jgi:CshA-type fibril repeat protein
VIAVEHSDATIAASAGETVQLAVPGSTQPAVADVRLQLDDLPDGSTLTSDGHTVVVPDEGTWTVSADLASLRFDPESSNLSNEPSPVQFSVLGDDGTLLRTATASVTTPVLPSMVRAAPYGDKIVMDLTDTSENVENSTLRLVPVTDVGITEVGSMGTWVEVAGQGRWELDRDEETVTFTPESADVRAASPVGITGNDQNGHTSAVALLRAGYPAVVPQRVGGAAGSAVSFTPMNPSRDARTGSLGFVPINDQDDMPEGATVPGSGTWSIGDQGTVTFDPESEFDLGTENSIKVSVQGAYANNRTTTTLTALTSDPPATARDDHLVTETGTQTRTDLLANDTAGAPSRPLQAATVRLRSVDAGNLDDLEEWSGTRLVLPEQGEFVVSSDGVLTFTPVPGFVGTTTAVQYDVADSAGVPTTASVTVDVNPTGTATDQEDTDAAGINSMLHGVLDSRRPGASAFGAIALALGLAGVASVWIGARMEADRRTWLD